MALPPLLNERRARGLAAVAALMLVQAGAAGAAAFATRALFAAMHGGGDLPATAFGVLVAAGVVVAATRVAARTLGERLGQDYARCVRRALFDHAAGMPAGAVAARRAGSMSLRFVGDMTAFRNWVGMGLPRLVAGAVSVPATLAILWLLDPVFALVVLPVVALALLAITLGGMGLVGLQRRLRMGRARIAADMAERMPLAPHLDRLGRRRLEIARLDRRTDAMIRAALRHRVRAESLRAIPDIAAGLAAALVILAGHGAGTGTGSIAAALAALGLLLAPLRELGGVWNHRAAFRAAAAKAEIALSRPQRPLYRGGRGLPRGPVSVTFDAVALPSGQRFDRHVAGGARAGLALDERDGEAVMEALLGLDTPAAGRILLSGVPLAELSRGSLRRGVHRIGAAPEILQGSLRRALLMGAVRRPDDATLARIARDAGLGPLVARLGGLGGTVREGGRGLTRSERIGLTVARMILNRPRLILLDGDLDVATQARVAAHPAARRATVIAPAGPPGTGNAARQSDPVSPGTICAPPGQPTPIARPATVTERASGDSDP